MSWDVIITRFPEGFDGDFDKIADDWEPETLFTQDFFEEEIKILFPNLIGDKTWLTLNAETYSIEFNIGEDESIKDIMLHVRGSNDALKAIEQICKKFNCQALDTTKSELIDFNKATNEGFTSWREYRDNVVKKNKEK